MHDREVHTTHTVTDTGGGTATGMLLGIVLVLLVLAVAAFFFFGNGFNVGGANTTTPRGGDTNIEVNPPSQPKVDVNINPPAQNPGGGSGPAQPAPSKP